MPPEVVKLAQGWRSRQEQSGAHPPHRPQEARGGAQGRRWWQRWGRARAGAWDAVRGHRRAQAGRWVAGMHSPTPHRTRCPQDAPQATQGGRSSAGVAQGIAHRQSRAEGTQNRHSPADGAGVQTPTHSQERTAQGTEKPHTGHSVARWHSVRTSPRSRPADAAQHQQHQEPQSRKPLKTQGFHSPTKKSCSI